MRRRNLPALLSGIALSYGAASVATADLYRCTKPDGSTVFSDSRATCPGANRYEPRDALQTMPRVGHPTPAAPAIQAFPPGHSAAVGSTQGSEWRRQELEQKSQKAEWQNRKRQAETDLARIEERTSELHRFVTACNRGGEIIARDQIGLKHQIPCDAIRGQYEEIEAQKHTLRAFLESGLRRECRRAGCLPGWIR